MQTASAASGRPTRSRSLESFDQFYNVAVGVFDERDPTVYLLHRRRIFDDRRIAVFEERLEGLVSTLDADGDVSDGVAILGDAVVSADIRGLPAGYFVVHGEEFTDDVRAAERNLVKLRKSLIRTDRRGTRIRRSPPAKNSSRNSRRFASAVRFRHRGEDWLAALRRRSSEGTDDEVLGAVSIPGPSRRMTGAGAVMNSRQGHPLRERYRDYSEFS